MMEFFSKKKTKKHEFFLKKSNVRENKSNYLNTLKPNAKNVILAEKGSRSVQVSDIT